MSVSVIVHFLEAATAILFAVLCVQLIRHYRLSNKLKDQANKPYLLPETSLDKDFKNLSDVFNQLDAVHEEMPVRVMKVSDSATELDDQQVSLPNEAPIHSEATVSSQDSASAILDDYIGGFFSEASHTAEPEIKAFRAVEKKEADSFLGEAAGNDTASSSASAGKSEPDLSFYKASTKGAAENGHIEKDDIPTLRTQIPESVLTERFIAQAKELDEQVIVVEESKDAIARDDIMSDKVVLAMLDEAKLASAN